MSNLLTIHNAFATACYQQSPQLEYQFGYGSYMDAQYLSHQNKNTPTKPNKYPRVLLEIPSFNTKFDDKKAQTTWRFRAMFADVAYAEMQTKKPRHRKFTDARVLSELHSLSVATMAQFIKLLEAEGAGKIEMGEYTLNGDTELNRSLMDGAIVVEFNFTVKTNEKLNCIKVAPTDKYPSPLDTNENILPLESVEDNMYVPK